MADEEKPSNASPFLRKFGPRIALFVLIAYVSALAVYTADQVFRLGWFPPALHRWVYDLVDVLQEKPWDSPRQARENLRELHAVLAETRLARAPSPESLEVRIADLLAKSDPVDPDTAKTLYEEGKEEARRRLTEIEDFVSVPIFIDLLDHPDPVVRKEVFGVLKQVLEKYYSRPPHNAWKEQEFFGYDPSAPPAEQKESLARWNEWLAARDLP